MVVQRSLKPYPSEGVSGGSNPPWATPKAMEFVCEQCGKKHNGQYGSGRFCSKSCANAYSASSHSRITLDKLESGKCPNVSSSKLRSWLLRNGLKKNACEQCGLSSWNGHSLVVQVHHIDGNKHNNKLSNLQMLCPNCHSITDTYGFKGVKYKKGKDNAI